MVKCVPARIDFSHECRAGLRTAIFLARVLEAPLELLGFDPLCGLARDCFKTPLRLNKIDGSEGVLR